jgi:hypothetical protein
MQLDVSNWPIVPEKEQGQHVIYHAGLEGDAAERLAQAGWEIVDVRLLPSNTDAKRAEALKCWLVGIRMGTIEPEPKIVKFVDLEARYLGLYGAKGAPRDKPAVQANTMEKLLDFGRKKV